MEDDDIICDEEWNEYFERVDKVKTKTTNSTKKNNSDKYQQKHKKMEERFSNFQTFSNGLIEGNFIFKAEDYTYVERGMNSPADSRYNVSVFEEDQIDAEVKVSLENGTITVEMPNLQIKNRYFPKYLKSTLKFGQGNIFGNDEDFKICAIPLSDIITSKNSHARMELIIQKGAIGGVNFVFSDMDDNFQVYETILNLYGEIKEYI